MQYTRFKKSLLVSSIAATMWSVPTIVHSANVLEEVVVTARKRQESLQETPIAISAMSGDQMAQNGVNNSADLRAVVPNVDIYSGNGTTGAGNIFIRGVGARNTGVNYDSGVGIYLDDIYLSRPDGAILDNVDVANLQVLRGPQGTLFGKNTTGGAILYSTNKPTDKFEGRADVRVGSLNRLDGKLTVNVPLIADTLNSRFSVFSTKRDGYVKNVDPLDGHTLNKLDDEDRFGGQAHFLWLVNSDIQIDFNNFYTKTDQAARGQKCQNVTGQPGSGWQAALQDTQVVLASTTKTIAQNCAASEALPIDKVLNDLDPNRYFSENYTSGLTVNWDINDSLSFKSVTAFRGTRAGESNDLDAMSIPLLHRTNYVDGAGLRKTKQLSQELQLSGNAFDEKLDFVAGLFGFSEKSNGGASAGLSGPFFGTGGFAPVAFYQNTLTTLTADNSSVSAFSQVDWKFDDVWSLTGGLRYTKESRELTRTLDDFNPANATIDGTTPINVASGTYFYPGGAASFNPNPGYIHNVVPFGTIADINDQKLKVNNSAWTPMISLQRTLENVGFIETGSVYATMSKGFLSGGLAEALDPITQKMFDYKPEKVTNYEVGFKFDALDRRVRLNTAVFYLDYTDRQLTSVVISNDGRVAGIPINAKKSHIEGIEIESQFIPVDNLELTVNLTFNHGVIDKFDDHQIRVPSGATPAAGCQRITVGTGPGQVDFCDADRTNEKLPRLPEAIYFTALQYTFNTPIGDIVPRVQWSLRTNVDNCFDISSCNAGTYKVNQQDVGARLTWTSPDKAWGAAAYATNLTDQRYITGGTPLVDVTQTAGTVYNEPRMYGFETHYSW
jgi:iron complex outermembrane receptor protein